MAVHDLIMAAAGAGAASPSPFQFVTSASSGGTTATQTFSTVSIGAAFSNRRFVVGFTCGAGAARTISSATFGGVAMTALADVSAVGITAFYEVSFPTGTTADIVFNLNLGSLTAQGFLALYSIEKASAVTLVDSASGTSTATVKSVTLNTTAGGSAILAANQFNSTGGAATLSSISGLDATDASNSTTSTIRTFSTDLVTPTATGATYSATFSKVGNAVDKYLGISIL